MAPAIAATARRSDETYKEAVEEAKKDPSAKKTTNADGNVYAASDGSIAIVEAKNGNYIAVQNNGSWLRVTPEGEVVTVDAKGSWALLQDQRRSGSY